MGAGIMCLGMLILLVGMELISSVIAAVRQSRRR